MTDKALDLLRHHHEYADKIENYVATNEVYFADCGDNVVTPCRRWYWQSDLRKETIAALAGEQEDRPKEG